MSVALAMTWPLWICTCLVLCLPSHTLLRNAESAYHRENGLLVVADRRGGVAH